ncbi:stress-induced protein, KGG, repeat-containing protein [Alteribacillus sp. YIM 98480]|uniref:stress-induced protein, KGG, repeat-containing protein n=1 Tax=Alteribacillus sp. YIM 98480 TaxID=2606599 RepID=UPI00131C704D|nr:stress-induced protein, KGG, repeat-containing protein [Alteribacillus sp. YIM 98480]
MAERQIKMSREEAGKRGGQTTSEEYSQKHFEEIGQKGGETTSKKYGQEHFEEIGQKGGRHSSNNSKNTNSNR